MSIWDRFTSAALNTLRFPGGLQASLLDDRLREQDAELRSFANDVEWPAIGKRSGPTTYTYVSANSFKVMGANATADYCVGRRVKGTGTITGTKYGTISATSFATPDTLVTVSWDSGGLSNDSNLVVAVGTVSPANTSLAGVGTGKLFFGLTNLSNYFQYNADGIVRYVWADDTATAGPYIDAYRNSASPANNDYLGGFRIVGKSSSGVERTFVLMRAQATSVANTNETALFELGVISAGNLATKLQFQSGAWSIGGTNFYVTKTVSDLNAVGIELNAVGGISLCADNNPMLYLNRKNGGGALVQFAQDNTIQGTISISGTTVSYGAFVGHHPAEWAIPAEGDERLGTVVCTTDEPYGEGKHVRVETSSMVCDARAYGVVGGRDDEGLMVYAVGSALVRCIGRVRGGDLLATSDIPGVAQSCQDVFIKSYTLGKAIRGDNRTDERLLPVALMQG